MGKATVRRSRKKSEQPQRAGAPGKPVGSKKGSNFVVQGGILAAADITVRPTDVLYQVPLANKVGDGGNGYYNATYSIYSILLIMSSYGLSVTMFKMVSTKLAKNWFRNSVRVLYTASFYVTMASALDFAALWFGADYFTTVVIKMPFSAYALRALASVIWVMAYLGMLGGYFQGYSTMTPTVVSQIFEQVVNTIISIVAAVALFSIGVRSNLVYRPNQYTYAFDAAGGAIGIGIGAVAALLSFLLLTTGYRPVMKSRARKDQSGHAESYGTTSGALLLTVVSIIPSSTIYDIDTMVNDSTLGNVMTDLGQGEWITSDWGVWGKYHLLFNIPVAATNSLSSSLIPNLSRTVAKKNRKQVLLRIANAIRFAMIISVLSAVGPTMLVYPISNLLSPGMDSAMLAKMTMIGSMAVVFFSLSAVTNAVLQGINRMRIPITSSVVALVVHVGILYGLLYGMKSGIYGVVYANTLFTSIVRILNGLSIGWALRHRQEALKTFSIPTMISGITEAAACNMYQLTFRTIGIALRRRLGTIVCLMPAILVAMLMYFVLLVELHGVDEGGMRGMSGGTKLIGVARKLHLM